MDYYPDAAALINTIGILKYRLGQYEEALATLARSDAVYSRRYGGVAEDVAFIAMATLTWMILPISRFV